jgi:hypothetical protein
MKINIEKLIYKPDKSGKFVPAKPEFIIFDAIIFYAELLNGMDTK